MNKRKWLAGLSSVAMAATLVGCLIISHKNEPSFRTLCTTVSD